MNIQNRITKYTILDENDSLSSFDGNMCQQSHQVYEIFFNFLNEVKPKRILEIGTALGGFTKFLQIISSENNLKIQIRTYDIIYNTWYDDLIRDGIDLRVENIFSEGYTDVKEDVKNFINQEGLTLVLCDGGFKKGEFNVLSNYIKQGDIIMAHDYCYDLQDFEQNIKNKVWNWCEINEVDIQESSDRNNLKPFKQEIFNKAAWVCKIKEK